VTSRGSAGGVLGLHFPDEFLAVDTDSYAHSGGFRIHALEDGHNLVVDEFLVGHVAEHVPLRHLDDVVGAVLLPRHERRLRHLAQLPLTPRSRHPMECTSAA
jgi:hypothetical protein